MERCKRNGKENSDCWEVGGGGWVGGDDFAKACLYIYSGFADTISNITPEIDSGK